MEDAVSALEREFRRINIDLDYSSRRLESEYKAKGGDFSSVVTLVRRVQAARAQLAGLTIKVTSYSERRQELVLRVTQQQLALYRQLTGLLQQYQVLPDSGVGQRQLDSSREGDGVGGGGGEEDWRAAAHALASSCEQFRGAPDHHQLLLAPRRQHQEGGEKEEDDEIHSLPLPPRKRPQPASSSSIFEISQEDFQQVPAHVRGRCALLDANNLLHRLQEDFLRRQQQQQQQGGGRRRGGAAASSAGRGEKVSLSDLEAAGLRVCGQTGRCVLGVLQRLGHVHWVQQARGGGGGETVELSAELCRTLQQGAPRS